MRFDKIYLDDVVEETGRFFALAYISGVDFEDFIIKFMTSKYRQNVDSGNCYYSTYSCYDMAIEFGIDLNEDIKYMDDAFANWVGYFYALLQWYSNLPSAEVVKQFTPSFVIGNYDCLHDLDILLAVERVLKKANLYCE